VEVQGAHADDEFPKPLEGVFPDLGLPDFLAANVARCKFSRPTPIQKHTLPIALAKRDIMACAQTGSGKTAAYLLPVIHAIDSGGLFSGRSRLAEPACVVLAPTRELTQQILEDAQRFCWQSRIRAVGVWGGEGTMSQQLSELSRGCHLLIATPGRLLDLIDRGKASLRNAFFLVLDEADRMLDMGFEPQIRNIVDTMPAREEARQTLMFSATFPRPMQQLAQDFLRDYIFVSVGKHSNPAASVLQKFVCVNSSREKSAVLLDILAAHPHNSDELGLTVIFVETKRAADFLESELYHNGFPAAAIHGDRTQPERQAALESFKKGETPFLVATDVVARGIDIPNVKHVINFDLPKDIEDYVHRIGRTGRAGRTGEATALVSICEDQRIAAMLVSMLKDTGKPVPTDLEHMAAHNSHHAPRNSSARAPIRDARPPKLGHAVNAVKALPAAAPKMLWRGPTRQDSGADAAWDD
jgi:ATP-dependent RNA helicase DDX3X